ncbi:FAD-dependent oxidoreductase [Streptomyces sp. NPDC001351]|uniref:FAD-dependent oxidoreductase n=1 Tax=Streptomyces sp. NPDC001351 TaxID=3364564 RepID=UPI0036BAC017
MGAGFLGAEAAAGAWRPGAKATLLEPAPVPLAHAVGAEVGAALARAHVERGVDLRCGVTVGEVTHSGVRIADGELVEGDEVLVGIGSQPHTEWLEGGGLAVGDGVEGDLAEGRFVAANRTGERVSGALAVGMPPRALRPWRQAIAGGAVRGEAVRTGATVPGV